MMYCNTLEWLYTTRISVYIIYIYICVHTSVTIILLYLLNAGRLPEGVIWFNFLSYRVASSEMWLEANPA